MIRRNLVPIICSTFILILGGFCLLLVYNFAKLGDAETFVEAFVRGAVDQGSSMPMPKVAPSARERLAPDVIASMLDRARQIGPLVEMHTSGCVVQTDSQNICGGQLLACLVDGQGAKGRFEAAVAMCRNGDLAAYELAGARWTFAFTDGAPVAAEPEAPI